MAHKSKRRLVSALLVRSGAPPLSSILEAPGSGREAQEGEGGRASQREATAQPGGSPRRPATGAPPSPAATSDSAASTPLSSRGDTPTPASGLPRGLALPGGMPRLPLAQHTPPSAVLQPQRESGDWLQYAQGVSHAGASPGGHPEQRSAGQQQRGDCAVAAAGTPDSDAGSRAIPRPGQRRQTAPPFAGSSGLAMRRGSVDFDAAPGSVALAERGGLTSAPASARSPLPTPLAGAAPQQQHRLAQTAGPSSASPAVSPPLSPTAGAGAGTAAPAESTHASSWGRSGGLARTTSAPAGAMLAGTAAAASGERRRSGLQRPAVTGMALGRDASLADLTSPEAVALQGRIASRLSHKVTDRLVQVLPGC